MAETKTKPTSVSIRSFVAAVENETRQQDAKALLKLFGKVTGWKAQMWGPTIIGFGAYHYTYDTGHAGSICVAGFSPRKANLVIYISDFPGKAELLKKLGKHKGGLKQCLYINKLTDVDTAVLEKIIKAGIAETKKVWPVTAS
jgi:hypothetical protein